jgi:hypothetical protein
MPFAGIPMVLFGDLAQIPAGTHARNDWTEAGLQLTRSPFFDSFVTYFLAQPMRQSPEEVAFLELLAAVRNLDVDCLLDSRYQALLNGRNIAGRSKEDRLAKMSRVLEVNRKTTTIAYTHKVRQHITGAVSSWRKSRDSKCAIFATVMVSGRVGHIAAEDSVRDSDHIEQ